VPAKEFLLEGTGSIRHMQLTAGGTRCYAGSWGGAVHVVDIGTGEVRRVLSGVGGPVYCLRIGGDRLYTSCGDGLVRAWHAETGEPVGVFEGHTEAVTDFCMQRVPLPPPPSSATSATDAPLGAPPAFTRRLVSSSYDSTVRVWDPDTFRCLAVLRGHRGPVWTVTVCAGGENVVSGSADGTIRVWATKDVADDGFGFGGDNHESEDGVGASGAPPRLVTSVSCLQILPPYKPVVHKQVFCLKVVGATVFAGLSDGTVHCYELPVPTGLQRPRALSSSSMHGGGGGGGGASAAASSSSPPRPSSPPSAASVSPSSPPTAGGGSAPASPAAEVVQACCSLSGPVRFVPPPSTAPPEEEPAETRHLWYIQAARGGDGIRRIDVIRDHLFTCTRDGNVGVFRMEQQSGGGGGGTGAGAGAGAGGGGPPNLLQRPGEDGVGALRARSGGSAAQADGNRARQASWGSLDDAMAMDGPGEKGPGAATNAAGRG
jgi:WD40 repeat protein